MGDFFNFDGPVFRYGNMLADMVILSFLWIIFSLPVITIGASTTAAYYVATRRISEKEGYLFVDFWKAFKREFLRITVLFAIIGAIAVVLFLNILFLNDATAEIMPPLLVTIWIPLTFVILIEIALVLIYLFPIAARFDMKRKELLKTAFFMANRHILITIALLAMLIGGAIIFDTFFTFLLLVFPGIYFYMSSYLFMRVFRKYRPEIDVIPTDADAAAASRDSERAVVEDNSEDNN